MPRTQHLKLQAQEEAERLHALFRETEEAPNAEPLDVALTGEMVCRTEDDAAAYPDAVYDAPPVRKRRRPRRRRREPDAPNPADDIVGGGASALPAQRDGGLWAAVALLCFALLAMLLSTVIRWHEAYGPFRQKAEIVAGQTIAQGVLVDGVHVGGMTRDEALLALAGNVSRGPGSLHITVQVGDQTWIITPEELPFTRNTAAVLDTAYAVGRQGSAETAASSFTPFEYRYQHLCHTAASPVSLYTKVTYDPATVRQLVRIVQSHIDRAAVDAQVATFDFGSRSFTFTEDRAGSRLDGDGLYARIVSALDRGDYQAVIAMEPETVTPRVTKAELMNAYALISSYTTATTSNANRNTNIDLACRAVSGTVVMPGETFSFNKTTGQRTAQKGYLPAAAISGGATVDEIGGGVCQVSSTLFNAAAMADMTVVSRSPHTWPSTYVEKGRDATVNWPNLDFSFRNDKETPIFIVAWYDRRKCNVEIYGQLPGGGQSIELDTDLTATVYPPSDPIYEQNAKLPAGTAQEKKKARTGYTVDTYRVYLNNGREYKRDLLCTSYYQMIQQVIEYN